MKNAPGLSDKGMQSAVESVAAADVTKELVLDFQ